MKTYKNIERLEKRAYDKKIETSFRKRNEGAFSRNEFDVITYGIGE